MKKRGEKSIKELYDLAEKIPNPEITPVLEGSCRIQGPVNESDHEFQGMNLGTVPAEKRYMVMKKSYCTGLESGMCNVCSAPCSSCMHVNRTTSVMESNVECGYTANKLGRDEADCCSINGADVHLIYKNKACDDLHHAASESSNLLSVSSSHDSYSENAESKAALAPNAAFDASDDAEMPSKMSGDAAVKGGVLPKETGVSTHSLLSSSTFSAAGLHQLSFTKRNEDQRQLECHGDNISCLTSGRDAKGAVNLLNADVDRKETTCSVISTKNLVAEGVETKPKVEACHILPEYEIKEDEIKPLAPSALKVNSLKVEPSEYLKEKVESSSGEPPVASSIERTMPTSHPGSKACQMKSNSSSGALASNYPSVETEICKEIEHIPNEWFEAVQCGSRIKSEKSSTLMETSKIQESGKQHQQKIEHENSVSDVEDVKVCDICGDAGREECLAICSRCSDGAEHIYCMRIMMEKVPEGNWLCEECKLKEDAENKKVDKTEELPAASRFPSMKNNENSESTSNLMLLPKLETKATDLPVKGVIKGIQSPRLSTKKHSDNLEVSSMNNKRTSESNDGSIGTSSPRKRITLSRESSFKNQEAEKANLAKTGPLFGNQTVNRPQTFARTPASGSIPSKSQTQLPTSRGSLSRSFSFNNSGMKGKVKQLIEKIPHKLKTPKEFASIDVRMDGVVRTMTKSASFRSVGSGRSGTESASKTQPLNSPRTEESRGFKQLKERNTLEKKNSFKLDRSLTSPSPTMSTVIPSKTELKIARYDGKLNSTSETNNLGVNKGLEDTNDLGCNEVKKQPLNTPKSFGSQSLNSCSFEGQKPSMLPSKEGIRSCVDGSNIQKEAVLQCSLPQPAESSLRDDNVRDSNFFSSSRQAGASSGRIVRCQRCNETGHTTQHCSIDKLRVSALKPSAERNSKEWVNKNCKLKDAAEAMVSKTKMQRNVRSLDQPQGSTMVTADLICEVESRNISPNCSSSGRNFPSQEGTSDQQEVLRNSYAGSSRTGNTSDGKQEGVHLVEAGTCGARESNVIISTLDELTVKSFGQMHPDCTSALEDLSRVSAIPEFDYIWQGDFEVLGTAGLPEPCNGVQAHLSTCASSKVVEVMTKFPAKVKLEEISRVNTWPLQFHRTCPKEDNIALFFFARDIKSYEKNYKKLLENMLKNDLALKGIIDGVELLIFPSNKLPEKSQRWNNLFFLWGVFREWSMDCLNSLPNIPKPCKSSFEMEPLVSGSVYSVSTPRKIDLHDILKKTSPKLEISQEVKAMKPRSDVDTLPVSTPQNKDMTFQAQEPLLIQPSAYTMGQLQTRTKSCADSGVQMSTSQLCLEQQSGVTHLRNFGGDPEGGRCAELQNNVQCTLIEHDVLPSFPIDWTSKSGREGSACGFRMEEKEVPVKTKVVLDNDHHKLLTTADLSCESKPLRKRVSSLSVDTASQISGETLKITDGSIQWKQSMYSPCVNNERENKKMKLFAEGQASSSSSREENISGKLSSKVHPLLGGFPNEQQHTDNIHYEPMMAESSRSTERYFFPLDLNSVSGAEAENVIHVLSSDDEDTPENNTPDLELALGGKKLAKQEMLPLFFPLVDRKSTQNKMPSDPRDDEVSASLSLSLAFPIPEKEQKANPVSKTEQLLPKRPCANTSLLLFGGFNDS